MTEFKQIIGRGTRINEDYDKFWFTIMDFKKVTELFADPAFDGDPVQIYSPRGDESPVPPDVDESLLPTDEPDPDEQALHPPWQSKVFGLPNGDSERRIKFVVGDVAVSVVNERVQYYGADGRLVTESLRDYTRACINQQFASLEDFLRKWKKSEQKKVVIEELESQGLLFQPLADEVLRKTGKILDPFDLICHVAFDQPPLSRRERADSVKKRNYFERYGEQARLVLEALLEKYADTGIENIEDPKVLQIDPFSKMGTPPELVKHFGDKAAYLRAVKELEDELYA
jgi:type I restriction enzyme R subunit